MGMAVDVNHPPKVCIFCGGTPPTKEHVISDWLGTLLPKSGLNYGVTDVTIDSQEPKTVRRVRSGHPISRRVKRVCRGCNGGWMKGLVDASKPLVTRLVQGQSCRVSRQDQEVLAAWIAVAVVVSEWERRDWVTVPPGDRDKLWKTHRPPDTWKIWVGDYRRESWKPQLIHQRYSVTRNDHPQVEGGARGRSNTQSTTYVVGRLFVHVLSSEVLYEGVDLQFQGANARLLRQIWPPSEFSVLWPPPTMDDRDADRIAGAMMQAALRGLGLPSLEKLIPP